MTLVMMKAYSTYKTFSRKDFERSQSRGATFSSTLLNFDQRVINTTTGGNQDPNSNRKIKNKTFLLLQFPWYLIEVWIM